MTAPIQLDGLQMNAVQTAPSGVIDARTVFDFHQTEDRVHATYTGGRVERGYLVGLVREERFEFHYCQLHTDGSADGGHSQCELRRSAEGRVQIVEHFEWGGGKGTNVIEELPPRADGSG